MLLNVSGPSDLGLFEVNEAAEIVAKAAHPDSNIIFGAVIDDTLGDEVKVTVIAAGFDSGQLPYKKVEIRREPAAVPTRASVGAGSATDGERRRSDPAAGYSVPTTTSTNGARATVGAGDDLDVPDFLKS
jgi:cell division protein FtsZ